MPVSIVGIVNVTPDSFSDGDQFLSSDKAINHAKQLIDDGADVIEFGGDSTRPGSQCVGIEEEWRRIQEPLLQLARKIPVMIDTHHAEIARRASQEGARFINDISGGLDPDMAKVICQSDVRYIAMYLTSKKPHLFEEGLKLEDCIPDLERGLRKIKERVLGWGIAADRLILDTAMGAFLSHNPEVSWQVIKRYDTFFRLGQAMLFGCSRKGFLRGSKDDTPRDRDPISALCGSVILTKMALLKNSPELFLRVHNVKLQREFISASQRIWPD